MHSHSFESGIKGVGYFSPCCTKSIIIILFTSQKIVAAALLADTKLAYLKKTTVILVHTLIFLLLWVDLMEIQILPFLENLLSSLVSNENYFSIRQILKLKVYKVDFSVQGSMFPRECFQTKQNHVITHREAIGFDLTANKNGTAQSTKMLPFA